MVEYKFELTAEVIIEAVDRDVAQRLAELKAYKGWHFAFDWTSLEPVIREKCGLLREYGIDLRHDVQFYVYVDSDEQFEDGKYRCEVLKELGTNAFVMYNIDKTPTRRINQLRRWANRKWLYWKINLEDYDRGLVH